MDQTSFQAVTKLEQKLEQNRLQRQKLKHELGENKCNFINDHDLIHL